jgi:uncharacterized protein YggT (Ycf19 family)
MSLSYVKFVKKVSFLGLIIAPMSWWVQKGKLGFKKKIVT